MYNGLDQGEGYTSCVGGFTSIEMRLVSLIRPDIPYLFGLESSSLYTCNTILHSVYYIIHYSAISKNIAADYQSISRHDIICTGMNCTMIQYNSLSECSVSSWNTSHLIIQQILPEVHNFPGFSLMEPYFVKNLSKNYPKSLAPTISQFDPEVLAIHFCFMDDGSLNSVSDFWWMSRSQMGMCQACIIEFHPKI